MTDIEETIKELIELRANHLRAIDNIDRTIRDLRIKQGERLPDNPIFRRYERIKLVYDVIKHSDAPMSTTSVHKRVVDAGHDVTRATVYSDIIHLKYHRKIEKVGGMAAYRALPEPVKAEHS